MESFICIKAYMLAFSGRFSRKYLEGISFNFFVCFIFKWSIGSAPKQNDINILRYTRTEIEPQFTSNWLSVPPIYYQSHLCLISINNLINLSSPPPDCNWGEELGDTTGDGGGKRENPVGKIFRPWRIFFRIEPLPERAWEHEHERSQSYTVKKLYWS